MSREEYIARMQRVRENQLLFRFVTKGSKVFTYTAYVFYPLLLIWLFVHHEPDAWKAVLVPAAGFVLLSIFRYLVNAPRPYEVYDAPPLVVKNTKGKSFPSRHVFSIFIIAFTAFKFYPWLGCILGLVGVQLAVTRVLAGVHFPRDVIAGALIGIGMGLLGFLLLAGM